MKTNIGTPKTLREAISNGLQHGDAVLMGETEADELAEEIEPHIRDYINQKLTVIAMTEDVALSTAAVMLKDKI